VASGSRGAAAFEPGGMSVLDERHDLNAFRLALRAWFAKTVPPDWRQRMTGACNAEFRAFQYWWFEELNKVGLATPHWPAKWGGEDLSIAHQIVFFEELARADAPDPVMFTISLYHLPATLAKWGTQAQIERYLPGARRGEVWCQGFSEPGAGSDLASLRTSAIRNGDNFVVNGQKVWSSYAAYADYYLLLARTDPSAPKHLGISCMIVDLKSPGIDIRPIRQITGDSEFCEVFLDNVVVPAANLIGPENKGWQVAQSTLSAERGLLVFGLAERMNRLFQKLLSAAAAEAWIKDDQLRREFVRAYADLQAVRRLIRNMLGMIQHSDTAGDLPPIIKILYGETLQRSCELWTRIEGLDAQILRPTYISGGYAKGQWMMDYLNSWTWTIAGGSNEILRNVIAERQLGLPKEPKG
jgi:alkylation response protein AidB-like acyl-CoA dehydrogenase